MDLSRVCEWGAAVIVRGLSDGEVLQGDAALAAILGASSPGAAPKPENVDASGLPVGTASAATNVIEVATVGAVILAVLFAMRLFK